MIRSRLIRTVLALAIGLGLSGCGYSGWVRYPCQNYENWNKEECKPPRCIAEGVCTKDLFKQGEIDEWLKAAK